MSESPYTRRNWSIEELRVLAAIYFNSDFSIGDDGRDECRAIADTLGRTPSSIDRQWRNLDAVIKGKPAFNVGGLVRKAASQYLAYPQGSKELALSVCERNAWPLQELIIEGRHELAAPEPDETPHREVVHGLIRLSDRLQAKVFSSGSQGFFAQGKIKLQDGVRFQAQITAVLIGSKNDLTIHMRAAREDLAYGTRPLIMGIEAKTFKTGRVGFYGSGKARVGDERYQVGIQAVQIGSK